MKVTLKNTRFLFYASIVNILVCALFFFFLLEGIITPFFNVLLVEYCLFMMLTLVYFIRVLMHLNEATAVIAAFSMFTGVVAISIVDTIFPRLLNTNYANWLGTLTEVISLLVAFRSFFLKTPAIRVPFRLFGAGLGLIVLPRLFVQLVETNFNGGLISITGDLGILIVLSATVFILKRMMNLPDQGAEQPVEVEGEQIS